MLTKIKLLFIILFSGGVKDMTVIRKGAGENPFRDLKKSLIFGDKGLLETIVEDKSTRISHEMVRRQLTEKIGEVDTINVQLRSAQDSLEKKRKIVEELQAQNENLLSQRNTLQEENKKLSQEVMKLDTALNGKAESTVDWEGIEKTGFERKSLAQTLVLIHNTNTRFSKDNLILMRESIKKNAKEFVEDLQEK